MHEYALSTPPPRNRGGTAVYCLSSYSTYITMAYDVPPIVNAFRKCTGWFPGAYNASAYTPTVPFDGGTVVMEGVAPNSLSLDTLSLPLRGILFCLLVTFIVSYARRSRQRLPPQPRRLSIIGNLFQLTDKSWLVSRDCKERFGEYPALI